jgi:hypothetical protein
MAKFRKSKANTKHFLIIPKPDEVDDEDYMRRKYKDKRVLKDGKRK